mmetsp:Transcript_9912/g.28374  ORF Transcript_9912/g.28374 Transcript_9912/m.28374 type:complete len:263 (+) Transcript_9912:2828-3616(+)
MGKLRPCSPSARATISHGSRRSTVTLRSPSGPQRLVASNCPSPRQVRSPLEATAGASESHTGSSSTSSSTFHSLLMSTTWPSAVRSASSSPSGLHLAASSPASTAPTSSTRWLSVSSRMTAPQAVARKSESSSTTCAKATTSGLAEQTVSSGRTSLRSRAHSSFCSAAPSGDTQVMWPSREARKRAPPGSGSPSTASRAKPVPSAGGSRSTVECSLTTRFRIVHANRFEAPSLGLASPPRGMETQLQELGRRHCGTIGRARA